MREVLVTSDMSFALSGKLALDAAGIRYTSNIADKYGFPTKRAMRLFVVDDADFERARTALLALDQSKLTPDGGWLERVGIGVLALMVLWIGVAIIINVVRG